MKKQLLSFLILSSIFTSYAQNQIPNNDFEDWFTNTTCLESDSLGNFMDAEDISYPITGFCVSQPATIKSLDAYSGSSALQLRCVQYNIFGTMIYGSNSVIIGTETTDISKGVPFTGRPVKLTGYYKFIQAGTDTFSISLGGYENGNEIFYGEFTKNTTVANYTKFEIPLVYDPMRPSNPTSLGLSIIIGNKMDEADVNTILTIDNLVFEYGTATSTTNYNSTSEINVFTSGDQIFFSDEVSDVALTDILGANKINVNAKTKTVNTNYLTNGLYIITYKYKDSYYSKKLFIE